MPASHHPDHTQAMIAINHKTSNDIRARAHVNQGWFAPVTSNVGVI
jgi:hypothetical protein